MNKIISILCVILIGSFINLSILAKNDEKNMAHAKLSYEPVSLEMHVKDSEVVTIAKVGEVVDNITLENVSFTITKIKIDTPLKGITNKGEEIFLLQTKCIEDPIVKKNEKVLLFLEKYTGEITDLNNTYVCKGLYQGHFKIEENKVKNSLINASVAWRDSKTDNLDYTTQQVINIVTKNNKTK